MYVYTVWIIVFAAALGSDFINYDRGPRTRQWYMLLSCTCVSAVRIYYARSPRSARQRVAADAVYIIVIVIINSIRVPCCYEFTQWRSWPDKILFRTVRSHFCAIPPYRWTFNDRARIQRTQVRRLLSYFFPPPITNFVRVIIIVIRLPRHYRQIPRVPVR